MPLLSIFLVLVIVGLALWLVNTYIPMPAGIKTALNIVTVVIAIVWLLKALHILVY